MRTNPARRRWTFTSQKAEGSHFGIHQFNGVKAAFLLAKGGDGFSTPEPKGRLGRVMNGRKRKHRKGELKTASLPNSAVPAVASWRAKETSGRRGGLHGTVTALPLLQRCLPTITGCVETNIVRAGVGHFRGNERMYIIENLVTCSMEPVGTRECEAWAVTTIGSCRDNEKNINHMSSKSGQGATKELSPTAAIYRQREVALPSRMGDIAKSRASANRGWLRWSTSSLTFR
jgi:hypothetical protein